MIIKATQLQVWAPAGGGGESRPSPPLSRIKKVFWLYWGPFCYVFLIFGGIFTHVRTPISFCYFYFMGGGGIFLGLPPTTKISADAHDCKEDSRACSPEILFRGVELGATAQDHSSFHLFKDAKTVVSFYFTKLSTIWLWYHIHVWNRLMCVPGKNILKSSTTSVTTLTHMDNRSFLTVLVRGMALQKTLQRPTL